MPIATITINGYLKDIAVNGYTFNKDAGFPTTGFKGAKFILELNDGNQAANYTWASDTSWVTVNDGVVAFTNTGTGKKVTITGTPKSGKGNVITYNFTLNSWFINDKEIEMTWADAKRYCSSQSGYSLETVQQLNGNPDHRRGNRGVMGDLWSEWGDLMNYSGADFYAPDYSFAYWSSEQNEQDRDKLYYDVQLKYGYIGGGSETATNYVVCRQGL